MSYPNDRLVQRPLTEDELEAALAKINLSPSLPDLISNLIITPYRFLLRDIGKEWETELSINPREYAITHEQSELLLKTATDRANDLGAGTDAVQVALTWMNNGVGSYTP